MRDEGQVPAVVDNGQCTEFIGDLQLVINRLEFFFFSFDSQNPVLRSRYRGIVLRVPTIKELIIGACFVLRTEQRLSAGQFGICFH